MKISSATPWGHLSDYGWPFVIYALCELGITETRSSETTERKLLRKFLENIKKMAIRDPSKFSDAWFAENEVNLKNAGIYELTKFEVKIAADEKELSHSMDILEAKKNVWNSIETLLSGLLEKREDARRGAFRIRHLGYWIFGEFL